MTTTVVPEIPLFELLAAAAAAQQQHTMMTMVITATTVHSCEETKSQFVKVRFLMMKR